VAEKDRIRTDRYLLTLLPEEKALLEKNAYELGLTQAEYLRKLIMYGGMVGRQWTMDKEQGERLVYEVNKIGTNVNQIAYNTNAQTFARHQDWEDLKKDFIELLNLIGEFPFLDKEGQEEWQQHIFTLLRKQ